MARMLLLVGTRKGCFVLESGEDRGKWKLRGPFCEGWPVYHAIYDEGSGLDLRRGCKRVARFRCVAVP